MENKENKGNFWVGFFLGGIFGLLMVILWGTKEGKKLAKLLAEKGEILEDDIEKKLKEIEEKGGQLLKEKIIPTLTSHKDKPAKDNQVSIPHKIKKPLNNPKPTPKKFFRKSGKNLSS